MQKKQNTTILLYNEIFDLEFQKSKKHLYALYKKPLQERISVEWVCNFLKTFRKIFRQRRKQLFNAIFKK